MFGLTVRRLADCPTSVVSRSATLDPSQSSCGSPDAFLNGRIASDTLGPDTAELAAPARPRIRSRSTYQIIASARTVAVPATAHPRTPSDRFVPEILFRGFTP